MFFDLKKKMFLHIFILAFFFSFLRSTWDEITKGYFKNYGFFSLERRGKKRRKNTVLMEKRKNFEKRERPGRDSNPRSSVHHGNHDAALRDRRLTTWPPSRSLKLEEKLKALNLVPKMLTHIN